MAIPLLRGRRHKFLSGRSKIQGGPGQSPVRGAEERSPLEGEEDLSLSP